MALTKCEKNEQGQYVLEFGVEKDVFEAAVNKVYRKEVKNMTIPGFRKGKAPRAMIEKMYGKGVFYEGAFNALLPEAYEAALKESALQVVGQPEFDVVSCDENGVVFSATVYVKPEVEIKDYFGIEATKQVAEVTDEEIDNEILAVRDRNSRETEIVDRAAENGDTVTIDFEGFADDVPFEGGKGTDYPLELGSGSFIPGFEEQIVGHAIGDAFDVNVTFPEEYHAEDLKGKPAVFKVTLKAIKKIELPELDDDFVKDVSEFDTVDAYRADWKAKLEKKHESAAASAFEDQLMKALMDRLVADIPEPMFAEETENFLRDYDNRLRMQGLDLNTYFKYTGMTLDSMREQFRPQAESQVKCRLALEKIAELENITPTDEEIDAEYEAIATAYNMEVEKVKEVVAHDAIVADMKVKKAMEAVKANAVIVAAPAAQEAPAAEA
ncbi:MAG: trigger factor [Clostridia bacterium]|nr:trigger factor [Clostridia bacterium]